MNTKNLSDILREHELMIEAATPGPWKFNVSLLWQAQLWISSWNDRLTIVREPAHPTRIKDNEMHDNAVFIAAARELLPRYQKALRIAMEQRNAWARNETTAFIGGLENQNSEIAAVLAGGSEG